MNPTAIGLSSIAIGPFSVAFIIAPVQHFAHPLPKLKTLADNNVLSETRLPVMLDAVGASDAQNFLEHCGYYQPNYHKHAVGSGCQWRFLVLFEVDTCLKAAPR
jgi:hypothetical protein